MPHRLFLEWWTTAQREASAADTVNSFTVVCLHWPNPAELVLWRGRRRAAPLMGLRNWRRGLVLPLAVCYKI